LFEGADGLNVVVEDGGGQCGVGSAFGEDFGKVIGSLCAAAGDDGNGDGSGNGGGESYVEAGLCAVAVHAGEEDFTGAEFDGTSRPGECVEVSGVATAADADVPVSRRSPTFENREGGTRRSSKRGMCGPRRFELGVDSEDYGLRAEFAREFGNQFGPFDGGGVDSDFVSAGADNEASVFERADAAAGGERNGEFRGNAANGFKKGWAAITRGGDVEHDEFVGTFGIVASSECGGIARIAQADEVDAFDDA